MLIDGAIYRFNRTDNLRYYRAAQTSAGTEFLYPIQVSGTRIADRERQRPSLCHPLLHDQMAQVGLPPATGWIQRGL